MKIISGAKRAARFAFVDLPLLCRSMRTRAGRMSKPLLPSPNR